MKKLFIISATALGIFLFAACGGSGNSNTNSSATTEDTASASVEASASSEAGNPSYDPHRGEGKYENYEAGSVSAELASKGKEIYLAKCQGCHKLTDERLVGPGWKGVTDKHSAAWILNFITNPDAMLDQDPELQKQIEICMVRMPNQNLADSDAKEIYDFMRQNDGKK